MGSPLSEGMAAAIAQVLSTMHGLASADLPPIADSGGWLAFAKVLAHMHWLDRVRYGQRPEEGAESAASAVSDFEWDKICETLLSGGRSPQKAQWWLWGDCQPLTDRIANMCLVSASE
jgi:hypothetical protein